MESQFNSNKLSRKRAELPSRIRSGNLSRVAPGDKVFDGVCIVGCEPACGKTVLMCGLAGVLADQGAEIRAIKPITYARQEKGSPEFSFISCITRSPIDYPRVHLSFPPMLTDRQWEDIVIDATCGEQITFVEMPGGAATPLCFELDSARKPSHEWRTTADLVKDLGFAVVLVARHAFDAFEKIGLSLNFLNAQGVPVVAIATVEANPLEAHFLDQRIPKDEFNLFVITNFKVPYLGCLRFSPSISVSQVNQGNLKRTTEECLDLLVLRRRLNVLV